MTLRIGLLAPQFPPGIGGMQELAFNLASGLAQQDQVTVYTVAGPEAAAGPFQVRRLLSKRGLSANVAMLQAEERHVDLWCAMDAGLSPLARSARVPFFAYFHGNDFLTPGYGFDGEWGATLKRKPVVWRFARAAKRFERRRVLRKSLASIREIFTNSRSTASLIDRNYPDHGRPISVIPPGVAAEFFQPHEPALSDTLRLITISRLTRQSRRKNVDGVLQALRLLRQEAPDLRFAHTIVGDGNDKPRLERLVTSLQLQDRVRFTGFVSRDELLTALRTADLFVLAPKATAYDVEGFGIVYIEASASGVPVIGSAEAGAVDAIESGTNGLLLESSSPEAIADGIRRFHGERHRYTPERVSGFAERFRWEQISERLRQRIAARLQA